MRRKVIHFKKENIADELLRTSFQPKKNSNQLIIWGKLRCSKYIFAIICLRFMTLNSALYISLGYKTKKIWSTKSVNYNIFTMYYIMDIY